ncbi:unnamed protein product [Gordionus sp. m RMFG-2023]|uniref:lysM and putative peptidoglycan-binding domain-containing protein 3-like n=1 Tax=Gordionus sp. m RMFG-2023 TaxID=3053472 RepID=UPI0030DE3B69
MQRFYPNESILDMFSRNDDEKEGLLDNFINSASSLDNSEPPISFPLRSRIKREAHIDKNNSRKSSPKLNYIEKDLTDGESLHTLALKYNCNIGELKRINNIQLDNEAFCKGKIKIPINFYNIEILEKEKEEQLNKIKLQKQHFKLNYLHNSESLISHNNDLGFPNTDFTESSQDLTQNTLPDFAGTNDYRGNRKALTPQEQFFETYDKNIRYLSAKTDPRISIIPHSDPIVFPLSKITESSMLASNPPLYQNIAASSLNDNNDANVANVDFKGDHRANLTPSFPSLDKARGEGTGKPSKDVFLCLPSECGLKLWIVLVIMIALCIALPVLVLWHFFVVRKEENW